jgi:flagellar basal-body rod protein FlgB
MTTQDLTVLQAAISKMHWNEARQKVLSQNIANADTPGYAPNDIKPLDFKELLKGSTSSGSVAAASSGGGNVQLATTNSMHIALDGASAASGGNAKPKKEKDPYETSPSGNSVILEEQLLKMNQNSIDHHLSTTIYQKNIDMLKDAIKSQ